MKILQIIDNQNSGGAEKQFREVIKFLSKKDIELYLYFPCWNKNKKIPDELRVVVKDIYIFNKSNSLDIFRIICKLNKLIKIIKPNIVHSWLYYSNLINILSNHNHHKKIISQRFDYKTCIEGNIYSFWRKQIIKFIDKKTDFLVVNSSENYNYLISKFKYPQNKIYYIPNGIKIIEDFIKKDYEIKNNEVKLLHIGNFTVEKNHLFFLPFIKKLRKICKFKLTLIGDGALRDKFLNKIKQEELSDYIDYKGKIGKVYKILKYYDIFVYPSISEGMPNALMEALGYGLPSISYSVGGCKDLIKNGINGFLVDINNLDDFFQLTQQLIENKDLREKLGKNATDFIKNNFSIDRIVSQYFDLYLNLLK